MILRQMGKIGSPIIGGDDKCLKGDVTFQEQTEAERMPVYINLTLLTQDNLK